MGPRLAKKWLRDEKTRFSWNPLDVPLDRECFHEKHSFFTSTPLAEPDRSSTTLREKVAKNLDDLRLKSEK